MTKYEPLTRFLAARQESRAPLSFEQIERADAKLFRRANETGLGHLVEVLG